MIRSNRTTLVLTVAACLLLLGSEAIDAQTNLFAEIARKAINGEDENGFCATVSWPIGTPERYTRWLEEAQPGSTHSSKRASGNCQYDEVIQILSKNGRKCVHYRWHTCVSNGKCGAGTDTECKQRDGSWDR